MPNEMPPLPYGGPPVLLMEDNPLVAEDIAATIQDVLGTCTIVVVPDILAARSQLQQGSDFGLSVIAAPPDEIRGSRLDKVLAASGCAVVVVADAKDDAIADTFWPRWGFAASPFTTASLTSAIRFAAANRRRRV